MILFFSFFASTVVTNFSDPWTRKSSFVPGKKIKNSINFRLIGNVSEKSQQRLQSDKKIALRAKIQQTLYPKSNKNSTKLVKKITFLSFSFNSSMVHVNFPVKICSAHVRSRDGNLPTSTIGTWGEKCRISGFHLDTTLSKDALDAIE